MAACSQRVQRRVATSCVILTVVAAALALVLFVEHQHQQRQTAAAGAGDKAFPLVSALIVTHNRPQFLVNSLHLLDQQGT